jgi:hypothetical protein
MRQPPTSFTCVVPRLNLQRSSQVRCIKALLYHISHCAEDHIKKHTAAGDKHIYSLVLTPRTSTLISQILEEEGVLGEITIVPFNLQFIPLEEDLLSLEHENAFKDIWAVRMLRIPSLSETHAVSLGWRRNCVV